MCKEQRFKNPIRKTAVIYARVSSKEQEKESFSIPAQLELLTNYASGESVPLPIPEEERILVNPDPALKRGALGSPGFKTFIPVINHGAFCGAG